MSSRRAGAACLLLGLLAVAVLHGRTPAPSIYDGIVVPPAPYRYVSPPPNLRNGNQPPLSGEQTLPVQSGKVAGGGVQTDDNQVIIFFGPGTFEAPAGSSGVRCSIRPVTDPPAPPSGTEVRGNVYAITCTAQPGGDPVRVANSYHLTLRLAPGGVNDIRYYDGKSWRNLNTLFAPGGDPYASVNAPGFGDYAAMVRSGAQASGGSDLFSTLGRYLEFFGILAFVLLFGIIALVQEIRRRRHRKPTVKRR